MLLLDINENGMTLITRESYFKRNFLLGGGAEEDRLLFKGLLNSTVLVNLRTYDEHSLVLHANDHLNNFVQLFILDGDNIVFLFNHGDTLHNLTVQYSG
jgi:hypothetical protein